MNAYQHFKTDIVLYAQLKFPEKILTYFPRFVLFVCFFFYFFMFLFFGFPCLQLLS